MSNAFIVPSEECLGCGKMVPVNGRGQLVKHPCAGNYVTYGIRDAYQYIKRGIWTLGWWDIEKEA